jgi:hypothetical protein
LAGVTGKLAAWRQDYRVIKPDLATINTQDMARAPPETDQRKDGLC